MEGAVTPNGRRTRAALAEIPEPVIAWEERSPTLPSGYLSPAVSPQELLIRQRGRKRLPVTWSPDMELKGNSTFHSTVRTPPKEGSSGLSQRSPTSRKRLLLDTASIPATPEKNDCSNFSTQKKITITSRSPLKKTKNEKPLNSEFQRPIETALKGLSPSQLIHIIKTITYKHPDIEQELRNEMPVPDLSPLEERLNYLKGNIFKSLPTSRLTSKTDSPAYSRISTHLMAFKKCVIDQGKLLMESQHWQSVIQYVFLAWSYVKATPVWDNIPHNTQRKQCFKALTTFCLTALNKGTFAKDELTDIEDKLRTMIGDSDELQSCLKYIRGQLQNGL